MKLAGKRVGRVGAVAVFPMSRAGVARYGVDPLAALPLERLHPCARARLTYGAEVATAPGRAENAARMMAGDEWQPYLEDLDRQRGALATAYRRLLDDPVSRDD
jgi:hypothetical protein